MSINVDLDNYNYAADELAKTSDHYDRAIRKVESVLGNLDYKVLAYVKEDLLDIKTSLGIMQKSATKFEEELLETKNKYEVVEEKAKTVNDKAYSIAAGIGGAAIGAATGGAVGAAIGGAIASATVSSSKVEEATGGIISKAFKSVSNFVTSAVSSVGNVFKKAGEVIKDTGAKVANYVTSAASKVASFFSSVGEFVWTGIKKVGASIANVAIGLIQGLSEFVEAIVDTVAIIGTAVASIFTGLWDLGQWIHGKITGNEDWNSATKAMWGGVMDFVATTHVKDAFRGFYENTAVGKWLDANAFEWFKSTGAVYQVANGIGYVAGVVILTIVTFGAGGAAVGAGSAATGAATTAVTAGQTAIIAGTAGFGRGAETAWSQGATLGEGLLYGGLNAGWEGLQFYVGAKIGAPGGYGDQIASRLLSQGASAGTRALVTSGTRIVLDSVDGGLEGFVQPLLQAVYADGYYDDAGNYIEFTDQDGVFTRAGALFDDMGGWKNVAIQTAIGGGGSALGEAFDLTRFLKGTPINGADAATATTAVIGTTSLIATTMDSDINLKPDLTPASITGALDDIKTSPDLTQAPDLEVTAPMPVVKPDSNTSGVDLDVTAPMEIIDPDATAPIPLLTEDPQTSGVEIPESLPEYDLEKILAKLNESSKGTEIDLATPKKVLDMDAAEISNYYLDKKLELDMFDPEFSYKIDLLEQQERLMIQLSEKLKGVNMDASGPKNIDLLTPYQKLQVEATAKQIYDNAISEEPSVSALMKSLEGTDAQLAGFDYRFKTLEGIQDKIARNLQKGYSLSDVNDSLRYTLLVDESTYSDTVIKKLATLRQAGYDIKYLNNSWGSNGFPTYQGLNVTLLSPEGTMIELQFHTQSSFDVKQTLNHDFYEISRNKNVSSDITYLSDQIQTINQKLYVKDTGFDINDPATLTKRIDDYISNQGKTTSTSQVVYKTYTEQSGYYHFLKDNQDNFASWQKALVEDPYLQEAIDAYKGESQTHPASYKIVNAYYRGTLFDDATQTVTITGTGGYPFKYSYAQYESMIGCSITEFKAKIETAASTLSGGIGKCHLGTDTQLIRGVHMDTLKYKFGIEANDSIDTIIKKIQSKGNVWLEEGYLSTCPRVSDNDLPGIVTSKKVQLIMDVESDIDARLYGDSTSGDWEMEVLLDKNQSFDITNVEEKNGKIYIYMKHRPQ